MFASALNRIETSASAVMTQRARAMRNAGRDVLALSMGQPDFDTPEHIKDAAKAAMDRGETGYPPLAGTEVLKRAIQEKFKRENSLDYDVDQILVSNGGKQIIFNAFAATINPGDEVIVPAPYWVSYPDIVKYTGGTPVFVETELQNGFRLTASALEAAITAKTRWLVLNSPNNPSGGCYRPEDLMSLAAVLAAHPHVRVLTDDIYEHLVFDGKFTTICQVAPELTDRVLTMNGVSKAYAMTGWRIGYAAGDVDLIKAMAKMQSQVTGGACSISQAAAAEALTGDQTLVTERRASFKARRDHVVARLNQISGLRCIMPDGAFYVFPDCRGWLGRSTAGGAVLNNDSDVAERLLEEQEVAVVHGAAYGLSPHIRISYATDMATLDRALDRINAFAEGLS
ncbi:MAG: pyridoxal phosphate-dependent aminotransferase [Rhodospirillaceae bacterium]